MFDQLNT